MQSIVPIIITLETQRGSPEIKLDFEKSINNKNIKTIREKFKKMNVSTKDKKIDVKDAKTNQSGSSKDSTTSKTQPPTLPEGDKYKHEKTMPTQDNCFGKRKYAEVVVETLKRNQIHTEKQSSVEPSSSSSIKSENNERCNSVEPQIAEKVTYFCGNPYVEKTTGILHFYRNRSNNSSSENDDCLMLCMLNVPSYLTCSDLINFIQPCNDISEIKIIRDSTPNQYMALLQFNSYQKTMAFYAKFNGIEFSPLETDKCNLVFVEKVETTSEDTGGSLPRENLTELPTCAVCLERLDDSIITVLCNHSFHSQCIQQWQDITCPVCRHSITPDEVDTPKCSECCKNQDLWMCLICGNIGCGRYVEAHAYSHFETTGHTFTLQVGGNLVWDYAGDNYVHRIIQNSNDGKLVEVQAGRNENDKQSGKIDEIQLEYTNMLTQQLDKQRNFFEDKIKAMEESMNNFRDGMVLEMNNLKSELDDEKAEIRKLSTALQSTKSAKESLEAKLANANAKIQKLQQELKEEQQISEMVRKDKEMLSKQKEDLVWKNNIEIKDLREQLQDLMMHFDAKTKIEGGEGLTQEELESASVALLPPKQQQQQKHRKKKKK